MDQNTRLEILRIVASAEPARPVRDLMTLAESLVSWVETRQFPEQITGDCKEGRRLS